jgi:hypothetical protein
MMSKQVGSGEHSREQGACARRKLKARTPLHHPHTVIRSPTHVAWRRQTAATDARRLTARWRGDQVATGHKVVLVGPVSGCPVKRVSGPLACGSA